MAGYEPLSSVHTEMRVLKSSRVRVGGGWSEDFSDTVAGVETPAFDAVVADASPRTRRIAEAVEVTATFEAAADGPPLAEVGDKLRAEIPVPVPSRPVFRITHVEDHGMMGKHTTYALAEEVS